MQGKNRFGGWAGLLLLFAMTLMSACGSSQATPSGVIHTVDNMVLLYQNVQEQASNFQLCVDTAYGKINTSTQQAQAFFDADVAKVAAWRDGYEKGKAELDKAEAAYKDAGGNPLPKDKLSMQDLIDKGGMPNQLNGGLALVVNSVVQAPVAPVNADIGKALIQTTNESFNSIQACGERWNAHVKAYNTERSQVGTDIIVSAANKLHLRDVDFPRELPYYSGGHAGQPVGNPLPQPTVAR